MVVFPGTVADRWDRLWSEDELIVLGWDGLNGSCFVVCTVLRLVTWKSRSDCRGLGLEIVLGSVGLRELELGPWLVLFTLLAPVWLTSELLGLELGTGLGGRLGKVPWIVLELLLVPLLAVNIEMWLEPGVVILDAGLRLRPGFR